MDVDAMIRVGFLMSLIYWVIVALAAWLIKKIHLFTKPIVEAWGLSILKNAGFPSAVGGGILAIYGQAVDFNLLQAIGGGAICLGGVVAGVLGKISQDLINAEKAAVKVKPDQPSQSA